MDQVCECVSVTLYGLNEANSIIQFHVVLRQTMPLN